MELRRVHGDDWQLWRDVRLRALQDAPEAFCSTYSDWVNAPEEQWRTRLDDAPLNLVAFDGGAGVGQVSCSNPNTDGDIELFSMWLAPSVRGQGLGDALIADVVRFALASRASAIIAQVIEGNDAAIALYERVGFEHVTAKRTDGDDARAPEGNRELTMRLAIHPGPATG